MSRDHDIERYLLGELPDDDTSRFDRDALADDLLASRIAVAEDALLDAYARRELDPERRRRVEERLLPSALGRERIAFAHALARRADLTRQHAGSSPAFSPRAWRLLAWAAALMIALSAAWLAVRPHGEPGDSRVTVVLLAAARGPGPPTVTIGPSTKVVTLEVALDGTAASARDRVRVHLIAPGGKTLRGPERVAIRDLGGLPALRFDIDAQALEPGRYRLEVASDTEASAEAALIYSFDLVRTQGR